MRRRKKGAAEPTVGASVRPRCTDETPCPATADGMDWTHTFDRIEGGLWDTLTCPSCGFELRAEKKESS